MPSLDPESADQNSDGQKSATHKSASRAGRSVVARWRILAQQRLDHLIELYESGRWKLYHKEAEFLAMVQEARAALKVWEQLAPPDPAVDKPVEVALAQDEAQNELQDEMPSGAASALPPASLNGVGAEYDFGKR
ncbi:MAG: TIGR03809 family protein [Bradyrhizobiaceae bacterium]|nr:MAG: TIGR03809 family protein [Bradyrhizobiaceae bacterium]